MENLLIKHERGFTRFLEMIPGVFAWTIILFPLIGGFLFPELVAYLLLLFIAYWFYKSFKSAFFAIRGYFLIKEWESTNWLKRWIKEGNTKEAWGEIKHVVIIPNYNEPEEVLERSLIGLKSQKDIDKKQLFVILGMEKRSAGSEDRAKNLIKKYKGEFGLLTYTLHPENLVGEIKGKASNETWAAKEAYKILTSKKIDIDKVTISSCDCDAIFHTQYFSALNYSFLTDKNKFIKIWQSPIFWYNNLHLVPFPIKIIGAIGHPVHLSYLQEPTKLIFNYSSYSLSFNLLCKVGYWHTDIIPEDWHLFLQAFFATEGKVTVEPIYLPTYIDAPQSKTWIGSLVNRYEQCKRHAWGATDIPYAIKESIAHKEIPFATKFARISKMIEGHIIWSTNWFLLTLGPLLPLLVNPAFARTSLGYNLPNIARVILTICLLALAVMIVTELKLRPEKLRPKSALDILKEISQWLFLPLFTLPLSVIPGLHAQTLLMIGKRMEYKVTEKV